MKLILEIESLEVPDNEEQRERALNHIRSSFAEVFSNITIKEVEQTKVHPPPSQL